MQDKLALGNLAAKRDWGFAGDYVEAIWMMLQPELPDEYMIATGETHAVQEFLELTFDRLALDWKKHVEIDPQFFRPSEVDILIGDAAKVCRALGWAPRVAFAELAAMIVDADLELARRELKSSGAKSLRAR